jgi:hypothetical protein
LNAVFAINHKQFKGYLRDNELNAHEYTYISSIHRLRGWKIDKFIYLDGWYLSDVYDHLDEIKMLESRFTMPLV